MEYQVPESTLQGKVDHIHPHMAQSNQGKRNKNKGAILGIYQCKSQTHIEKYTTILEASKLRISNYLLNNVVVRQSNSLLVNLSISSLVD